MPIPSQAAGFTDIDRTHWTLRALPPALRPYGRLARWDRPIGIWLLLFPGWWAVAMAAPLADGNALLHFGWLMVAFAIGAIAMRGAGCTWNDILDRDIDAQVERTRTRPLPAGEVGLRQAMTWMALQAAVGAAVLLTFNVFAVAVGLVNSLYLAPKSAAATLALEQSLKSSQASYEIQPRVFYEDFHNYVLYIQDVRPAAGAALWRNVFLADLTQPANPNITTAEQAVVTGTYRSHDPWTPVFRVEARGPSLWFTFPDPPDGADAFQRLVPMAGGWYRLGEDRRGPERVRFDTVIDGRARRALLSGWPWYRVTDT